MNIKEHRDVVLKLIVTTEHKVLSSDYTTINDFERHFKFKKYFQTFLGSLLCPRP